MKTPSAERGDAFLKEYRALVEKHQIDMANYPVFEPGASGTFTIAVRVTLFDMTPEPIASPLAVEDGVVTEPDKNV